MYSNGIQKIMWDPLIPLQITSTTVRDVDEMEFPLMLDACNSWSDISSAVHHCYWIILPIWINILCPVSDGLSWKDVFRKNIQSWNICECELYLLLIMCSFVQYLASTARNPHHPRVLFVVFFQKSSDLKISLHLG